MLHPTRRLLLAASLAAPRLAQAQTQAQTEASTWPRQTVRYINLYAPGGANDILSRLFCQAMTQITGQQFVVENRTGAGGTVGSDAIAKSRAGWLHRRAGRRRQPGHRALALPQPALRPDA